MQPANLTDLLTSTDADAVEWRRRNQAALQLAVGSTPCRRNWRRGHRDRSAAERMAVRFRGNQQRKSA